MTALLCQAAARKHDFADLRPRINAAVLLELRYRTGRSKKAPFPLFELFELLFLPVDFQDFRLLSVSPVSPACLLMQTMFFVSKWSLLAFLLEISHFSCILFFRGRWGPSHPHFGK